PEGRKDSWPFEGRGDRPGRTSGTTPRSMGEDPGSPPSGCYLAAREHQWPRLPQTAATGNPRPPSGETTRPSTGHVVAGDVVDGLAEPEQLRFDDQLPALPAVGDAECGLATDRATRAQFTVEAALLVAGERHVDGPVVRVDQRPHHDRRDHFAAVAGIGQLDVDHEPTLALVRPEKVVAA